MLKKILLILLIVAFIIGTTLVIIKIVTQNSIVDKYGMVNVPIDLPDVNQSWENVMKFSDSQCIAIGYITDLNEKEFEDKYFQDGTYSNIPVYDFRHPSNRTDGYGNKFVIIPKDENVNITVYDCHIDETDMKLHTDNTLIDSISKPFVVLDDYIEYLPTMCIKFEYNGHEETYPISFRGDNGHLDLECYETQILDISIY